MHLPQEIIEAIVEEPEASSLHVFRLASTHFVRPSQARMFRSLRIRVVSDECHNVHVRYYISLSPWKAKRLFSSSTHLTSYAQRLRIDIPPPRHYPFWIFRIRSCYSPIRAILPALTRISHLVIRAPPKSGWWVFPGMRWEVLPAALKHAMQAIMLLPSLTELHLCFLSMPAALLRLVAASVRR